MSNRKAISIQQSTTRECYDVEINSQNRVRWIKEHYTTHKLSPRSVKTYTVTQERLDKILAIVGHQNFYFDCDNGEITLFGEYDGRKA